MSSAHCFSWACSSSVKVRKAKLFDPLLVIRQVQVLLTALNADSHRLFVLGIGIGYGFIRQGIDTKRIRVSLFLRQEVKLLSGQSNGSTASQIVRSLLMVAERVDRAPEAAR